MIPHRSSQRLLRRIALLAAGAAVLGPATLAAATPAGASSTTPFQPGNLLVSTSTYQTDPNIVAGTTQLPPGCGGSANPCATAVAGGDYPTVFNNDSVDGSFGVTAPITLDQVTPSGSLVSQLTVPYTTQRGASATSDLVTSFSSKSEGALNQSTDGSSVSFIDYVAPVDATDVSNSNTPGAVDPSNPDTPSVYRAVAQLGSDGAFHFTETNAYSGNNGRAAVLNSATGQLYTAGNAGNGSNPEPQGVVTGAGAQILASSSQAESARTPGAPTPVGSFNVTQVGISADKSAKDNNFRGLNLNGNVLYYTKGSGGNGVNTVYFVDTTGTACPNGTGLPAADATLPTTSTPAYSTANAPLGLTASNPGLAPTNMCVLNGFPTASAKGATDASDYPFGLWFANPTTLYVADEGAGDNAYSSSTNTYTAAAASTTAGLQKWVLDMATGRWNLTYTLQSGLNLGQPSTVPGYPTGNNSGPGGTGMPWAPATDGLRNLTGHVNGDGTVTLDATTSTVSGSGDQGADPNQLVSITDHIGSVVARPASERFTPLLAPTNGIVVRGVSFTPGTTTTPPASTPEVPWAPVLPLAAVAVGGGLFWQRSRRQRRWGAG